ncbi:MAG: alpha/beta fold hydrolase [Dehalococcoidia bacterium]
MEIDFVELASRDKVRLVGSYFAPRGESRGGADAIVLCPGTSAEFYSQPLPTVAHAAADAGYGALTLSTRGRGIVWRDPATGFKGAGFERISDCVEDFAGAIDFLARRGHRRVVLWGHSLSGVKVLYAAAHDPHPAIAGVISVAGPRWSAEHYLTLPVAAEYERHRRTAEAMVAEGRGGDLFPVAFPPARPSRPPKASSTSTPTRNTTRCAGPIRSGCALPDRRRRGSFGPAVRHGRPCRPVAGDGPAKRRQPGGHDPNTDHLFSGAHDALASAVVGWLDALPVEVPV